MPTRFSSLILILLASALLTGLDFYALHYYLFWKYWWFDVMLHTMAGFIFALIYAWLITFEFSSYKERYGHILYALGFVIFVGIVWEIFEFHNGVIQEYATPRAYAFDTMKDICMDTLGGIGGYLLSKKIFHV